MSTKKEDLPPDQYAARVLAVEMEARQRKLDRAMNSGNDDATIEAATEQAILFKENMPFIVYCLKKYGGLNPPVPMIPRNDPALPRLSEELFGGGEPQSRVMGASGNAVAAATMNGHPTKQ